MERTFIATVASTWVVFSVASALSALRYVLQRQKFGHLLCEDYVHMAAWIQCLAYMIIYELFAIGYFDFFSNGTNFQQFYFDMTTAQSCLYWTTVFTCKAVFLILYRRVFGVSKAFNWAWWATVVVTILAGIAGFLTQFFYCGGKASNYRWNNADCISITFPVISRNLQIVSLTCNSGTDILIMCLPLYMLSKMKLQRSKKARLIPVFLLGWATIIIDVLSWAPQISQTDNVPLANVAYTFIGLEPPVTVIVAALPTIMFANIGHGAGSKRRHIAHEAGGEETLQDRLRAQLARYRRVDVQAVHDSLESGSSGVLLGPPTARDNIEAAMMSEAAATQPAEDDRGEGRGVSVSTTNVAHDGKGRLREAQSFS